MGNFQGEKNSRMGSNKILVEKTFADCSPLSAPKDTNHTPSPTNFMEKIFASSYKTSKFAEVYSLKSFLRYRAVRNFHIW